MHLDQGLHAQVVGEGEQVGELRVVQGRDDEQHQVGAGGPSLVHLVLAHHEVLAQQGQVHRGTHSHQVGQRPPEPAALGEHRDRRGAGELVGAGEVGRLTDGGQHPLAGAAALDLCDQGGTGGTEGTQDRARRGHGDLRQGGPGHRPLAVGDVLADPLEDRVQHRGGHWWDAPP